MKSLGKWWVSGVIVAVMASVVLPPPQARAENAMREFIMSCTYGVLAGTLVGTALLAFTDQPGKNLNMVARGASIGLYTGILLGVYVVYFVPSQGEEAPEGLGGEAGVERWQSWKAPKMASSHLLLAPSLDDRGAFAGAELHATVFRF